MIDQKDVISFFDRCAPGWDAEMIRNEPVIRTILDNAGIRAGVDVLDVACGTGVLFPDYLARDVHSVTGVDIAPEMARRAAEKFPDARVTVLCGDIETVPLPQPFDCCMVYNAFPHFPDPARLIAHLVTLLKPGGRLSIAHGMSRAMLDRHHAGSASKVSISLMSETELAALMADAERGLPYEGAKEHYILDIDDTDLARQVVAVLEAVTPLPKPKKKVDERQLLLDFGE